MVSTTTDHDFAASATTVRFRDRLTGDRVDEQMVKADSNSPAALFDLSAVRWADPTALVYMAAVMKTLHGAGVELRIELPEHKPVRDIMRRYRFGAVIGRLLDVDPLNLLTQYS